MKDLQQAIERVLQHLDGNAEYARLYNELSDLQDSLALEDSA